MCKTSLPDRWYLKQKIPISAIVPKIFQAVNLKLIVVFLMLSFLILATLLVPKEISREVKIQPEDIRVFQITPTKTATISLVKSNKILPSIVIDIIPKSFAGTTYYINPLGNDTNTGLSANSPLQNIQKAVDLTQPGDLIYLFPGIYTQDILTKKDGGLDNPIIITGPKEAVVVGEGGSRVIEVKHNYITLKGFTLDGQFSEKTDISGFRDKLLYVLGSEPKKGVGGLKITDMTIQNSGGECIRLRYFAQNNEISGNKIANCGIYDFRFQGGGKNGEGIYIGTAPEQREDGKNPTSDPDESNNNWIHDNQIDTQGNECVDIKESSTGNIVENNNCTGQKDPKSGGMDSRGSGNTFRNNNIYNNIGAGIRLGGDSIADGTGNNIYNNKITGNLGGGIKFERSPQSKICGNKMSKNNDGNSVGTYRKEFNPTISCGSISG